MGVTHEYVLMGEERTCLVGIGTGSVGTKNEGSSRDGRPLQDGSQR